MAGRDRPHLESDAMGVADIVSFVLAPGAVRFGERAAEEALTALAETTVVV